MSLGDYFVPDPPVACPICGGSFREWEGYSGPGGWFVFHEGKDESVECRRNLPTAIGPVKMPDGVHTVFSECRGVKALAHLTVENGLIASVEVSDLDGGAPVPIVGDYMLWRVPGDRYCVATLRPTEGEYIPSSVTALGFNDQCIVATRRISTRDHSPDEQWYVIELEANKLVGPMSDQKVQEHLSARGFGKPDIMVLPDEQRR